MWRQLSAELSWRLISKEQEENTEPIAALRHHQRDLWKFPIC